MLLHLILILTISPTPSEEKIPHTMTHHPPNLANFSPTFCVVSLPLHHWINCLRSNKTEFTFIAEMKFRSIPFLSNYVFCIFKSRHLILFTYYRFCSWRTCFQSELVHLLGHCTAADLLVEISFHLPWNSSCSIEDIIHSMSFN